ncbi:MAG TPA: hypothetical protein VHR88_04715 [Solirubrobacteraceae bacterium]|jgi:predicted outer membrane repeat protein|nr:hypothetical protein [Solirubrobacteraceae bacterium]
MLQVSGCTFTDNTSSGGGGAIQSDTRFRAALDRL